MAVDRKDGAAALRFCGRHRRCVAALLHWAIFPITQSRVTFIFFIPAIVLATTIAGRWPGVLVAVIGLVNSAIMKAPGTLMVPNSAEQVALISSARGVGHGDPGRRLLPLDVAPRALDLHELHELSATLASIPELPEQLKLILVTFARMHGATQGLICASTTRQRDMLHRGGQHRLRPRALEELREARRRLRLRPGLRRESARGHRGHGDAIRASRDFATLRAREGVRAVHSTPLIGRDGECSARCRCTSPQPRTPTEREIRIADICARKAAVFIERARAEER